MLITKTRQPPIVAALLNYSIFLKVGYVNPYFCTDLFNNSCSLGAVSQEILGLSAVTVLIAEALVHCMHIISHHIVR